MSLTVTSLVCAGMVSDIAGGHKEGQAVCGLSGELLTQQTQ
jgi:hypothetical protein